VGLAFRELVGAERAAARGALGPGARRMDRVNEEGYERTLAAARAALGGPAFMAAWAEDLGWSLERTVARALEAPPASTRSRDATLTRTTSRVGSRCAMTTSSTATADSRRK
jgi:hypothetical protein